MESRVINFFPNEEKKQIYMFFAEQLWIENFEENKEFIKVFLNWAYKNENNENNENIAEQKFIDSFENFLKELQNSINKYDFINDILYKKIQDKYENCKLYKEWDKIFTSKGEKSRKTFIVEYLSESPADFDELWNKAKQELKLSKQNEKWFKRVFDELIKEKVVVPEHNKFTLTDKYEKYLLCKKIEFFLEEIKSDKKQNKVFYKIKNINDKHFDNFKLSTNLFDDLWNLLVDFKNNNDFQDKEVFYFLLEIYIS